MFIKLVFLPGDPATPPPPSQEKSVSLSVWMAQLLIKKLIVKALINQKKFDNDWPKIIDVFDLIDQYIRLKSIFFIIIVPNRSETQRVIFSFSWICKLLLILSIPNQVGYATFRLTTWLSFLTSPGKIILHANFLLTIFSSTIMCLCSFFDLESLFTKSENWVEKWGFAILYYWYWCQNALFAKCIYLHRWFQK